MKGGPGVQGGGGGEREGVELPGAQLATPFAADREFSSNRKPATATTNPNRTISRPIFRGI